MDAFDELTELNGQIHDIKKSIRDVFQEQMDLTLTVRYAKLSAASQIMKSIPNRALDEIISTLNARAISEAVSDSPSSPTFPVVDLDEIPYCHDHHVEGIVLRPTGRISAYKVRPVYVHRKCDEVNTDGDLLVKLETGWYNGMVMLGPPCKKHGISSISFQFLGGANASVGLAARGAPIDGWVNKSSKGWGYYQPTGCIGHGGKAETPYGHDFADQGDVVDVEYDAANGTLCFYTNGIFQGIAYDHIEHDEDLFFAVSLTQKHSRVAIYNNNRKNAAVPMLLMAMNRALCTRYARDHVKNTMKSLRVRCRHGGSNRSVSFVDKLLDLDNVTIWNIFSFVFVERILVGVDAHERSRASQYRQNDGFIHLSKDVKMPRRALWD